MAEVIAMRYPSYTLCHYGIKGQHWGVRNYQNEDGTLTAAGRIRYGVGEGLKNSRQDKSDDKVKKILAKEQASGKKISKHRLKLEAKYREKGMTKEEASIAAYKRARTEKIIAVTAATTIAAAAGYVGAKKALQVRSEKFVEQHKGEIISDYIRNNAGVEDFSIRKGTKFQRITITPEESVRNSTYNTFLDNDKQRYSNFLEGYGEKRYEITTSASKNIKIAGEKSRRHIFDDLTKNNEDFSDFLKDYKNRPDLAYDRFNWSMKGRTEGARAVRMRKEFVSEVKKRGYGGVVDYNDRQIPWNEDFMNSHYGPQLPVILNNMQDGITSRKIKEIA